MCVCVRQFTDDDSELPEVIKRAPREQHNTDDIPDEFESPVKVCVTHTHTHTGEPIPARDPSQRSPCLPGGNGKCLA